MNEPPSCSPTGAPRRGAARRTTARATAPGPAARTHDSEEGKHHDPFGIERILIFRYRN